MRNSATLVYNFFLIVGDFLALVAAFVGAYILRVTLDNRPLVEAIPARTYLGIFLTLLPFWILIFALLGLYNSNIYEKRFREAGRLLIGSFLGLLFVVFWDFAASNPIFPARLVPIYGFLLAFIFLVIFRNLARLGRSILFGYNIGITNIVIVGNTPLSAELVATLANSRASGYRIVGLVGVVNQRIIDKNPEIPTYSSFRSALEEIKPGNIHGIVQTQIYPDEAKNQEILEFAQTHHVGYRFAPGNSELFVGKIEVDLFRSSIPIITVHQTPMFGWGRIVKRLFDIAVSALLIIVTSPLMIVIAAINLLVNGAIVFRQARLTRYDQRFRLFKFQTIKNAYNGLSPEDAFAKMGKPELSKKYREGGDKLDNDPRYSKWGRFLYKTSLDELPQLFNVLKGDLSLVGPRALVPEELDRSDKRHAILSVKSGLTGLAVVSGRRDISFEERRQLDVYYVQNWTFWMDIVILLKTIRVVFSGSGAK